MTFVAHLAETFGPRLSDGTRAAEYRAAHIAPAVASGIPLSFDFTGVTNANSSFVNALLADLFTENGNALLERTEFKGCRPAVRVLVESAIALGLKKASEASLRTSYAEQLLAPA